MRNTELRTSRLINMANSTGSEEDMAGKAQHIWTMLEDMANSDPAAYRKFIDKHLKEGKEFMAPPKPHMCVQTSYKKMKDKKRVILYLNICEWKRIPVPKTEVDPVPISGGAIYYVQDDVAAARAIGLAFNPEVLKECGRDAGMREEQGLLISLCLDYVDKQYNLNVKRSYTVLPHMITHKGTLADLKKCLTSKTRDENEKVESELEKAFGSTMKESILCEISNMSLDGEVSSPTGRSAKDSSPQIQTDVGSLRDIRILRPDKPAKTGLIEELHPETEKGGSLLRLPEPAYVLTVKDADGAFPRTLFLRIKLPDVSSVSECELDIAMDDVHLVVADRYDLTVTFTEKVNSDSASAKFSTKTGTLTVTLPISSQQQNHQ